MEQELNIAYDQKLTREVWQRVAQSLPPLEAPAADTGSCGIAAPPPEDSTHRLRRFIDEELSMARAYRRQVRCAPPSARRTLLRLSDEELAHARTLLAAHYLLTGRYYRPPPPWERSPARPGAGCCGSCTVRKPAAAGPTPRLRKTRRTCVCGTFSAASVRRSTATPPPCCTCWKAA